MSIEKGKIIDMSDNNKNLNILKGLFSILQINYIAQHPNLNAQYSLLKSQRSNLTTQYSQLNTHYPTLTTQ